VQIDHAIDALVLVLQRHELRDRAEVIAEVRVTGRLHPGKHAWFECHDGSLSMCGSPMPWRGASRQGRDLGAAPATL
jgi:hypothetical protein